MSDELIEFLKSESDRQTRTHKVKKKIPLTKLEEVSASVKSAQKEVSISDTSGSPLIQKKIKKSKVLDKVLKEKQKVHWL